MPNLGTAWFQQAAWLSHMLGVAAAAAKACAQAARLVERVTGRAAACPKRSSSSGVQCLRSQHSRQLAPGPPVSLPAHDPPPARSSSPSLRAGRRSGAAHTAGGGVEARGRMVRQQRACWHLGLAGRIRRHACSAISCSAAQQSLPICAWHTNRPPLTSQTLSPKNASALAFQCLRGVRPCR